MTTPVTLELNELETTIDEIKAMDAIRQVLEHYDLPDDEMQRVLDWVIKVYTPKIKTRAGGFAQ